MYEVLKQMQSELIALKEGQREINPSLNAIRVHMAGIHQDTQNLHTITARHGARLDRIERRLENPRSACVKIFQPADQQAGP